MITQDNSDIIRSLTVTREEAHEDAQKYSERTIKSLRNIQGSLLANGLAADYKKRNGEFDHAKRTSEKHLEILFRKQAIVMAFSFFLFISGVLFWIFCLFQEDYIAKYHLVGAIVSIAGMFLYVFKVSEISKSIESEQFFFDSLVDYPKDGGLLSELLSLGKRHGPVLTYFDKLKRIKRSPAKLEVEYLYSHCKKQDTFL